MLKENGDAEQIKISRDEYNMYFDEYYEENYEETYYKDGEYRSDVIYDEERNYWFTGNIINEKKDKKDRYLLKKQRE